MAHRPGRVFDHRARLAPDPAVPRDLGSLRQPGRLTAVAQGDQLAVGQQHLNLERGFQGRRLTAGRSFQVGRTLGYQLSQCVNFWIGSRYAGLKSSRREYATGISAACCTSA